MLTKKPLKINPKVMYVYIMLVQFLILLYLILPFTDPMVFLPFLITVFSMTLRWRFDLLPIYLLIDTSIVTIIGIIYPSSFLCLFIFAYYFAYKNKFTYMILLVLIGFILNDITYYLLLFQSILLGTILFQWSKDNNYHIDLTDSLRRRIYDLESIQSNLLADYQATERLSTLTERQRIAEILHDSLGHELTAAHLSIKAYKTLLENNKTNQAQITFEKIEKKIEHSLEQLKDTVKSIEPCIETGYNDLNNMIENYLYPIHFTHSGHILKLKSYIWQLILMSIKESLTNIIKYAHPSKITISLNVTDHIVRLMIENDGIKENSQERTNGNGLRYMRSRLEAINGSLSIQKQDTFKLIIIIPLENGR